MHTQNWPHPLFTIQPMPHEKNQVPPPLFFFCLISSITTLSLEICDIIEMRCRCRYTLWQLCRNQKHFKSCAQNAVVLTICVLHLIPAWSVPSVTPLRWERSFTLESSSNFRWARLLLRRVSLRCDWMPAPRITPKPFHTELRLSFTLKLDIWTQAWDFTLLAASRRYSAECCIEEVSLHWVVW